MLTTQHTTKPQTSNYEACSQGWQGQNTGPNLAAVEQHTKPDQPNTETTMTSHQHRLFTAWRLSGLSFLGITFERALRITPIRISRECAVKHEHKGKSVPSQPALI